MPTTAAAHANQGGSRGTLAQRLAGLAGKALLDGRDVRPTLDFRSIFKAVLADHIRIEPLALTARVFPNSQGAPPLHGLIRA